MNRVIKFRAWDKINKEYHNDSISSIKLSIDMNSQIWRNGVDWTDRYVLQFFTGLLDKNGKEVFEGDVVKILKDDGKRNPAMNHPDVEPWWSTIVIESLQDFFEEKGFAEKELLEDWSSEYIEVIGNIYENPNLTNNE